MTGTMSRDLRWVEPGQHLVEQQQLRLGRERARQLEPLAAGDRQGGGRLVEHRAEADARGDVVGGAPARRARSAMAQMRADRDVLAHRQPGEGLHDLEGARDAAPRRCDAAAGR